MKKTITAALIAGAATAALMGAGTAQADSNDVAFINVLNSRGIKPSGNDYTGLTNWGKAVCNQIDAGNSVLSVARSVYRVTPLSDLDSGYFVGASIRAYCPWDLPLLGM